MSYQQQGDVGYGNQPYQQVPSTGYQQVPPQGYQQPGAAYAQQQGSPQMAGGYGQQQGQQAGAMYAYGGYTPPPDYRKSDIPVEGQPLYDSQDPELSQHFRVSGYKDVWAMVLFYMHLIAVIVVAIVNLTNGKFKVSTNNNNNTDPNVITFSPSTKNDAENLAETFGKAAAAAFGLAVVLTVIMLFLIKAFASVFIWIANIMIILLFVGYAIWGFAINVPILGVFGLIMALILSAWLFCVRNRIPFSALLLETSTHCVMKFHGSVILSFITLIIAAIYLVFWSMMTIPTMASITNNDNYSENSGNTAYWAFLGFLLLFFWAFQTFQNVVHVTTSGAVATWYFVGEGDMPPNPSWAAFKRAMTTSFGSICFGSLVVAILKVIEYMARSAARQNRNSFAACIALCIISCIERLMEYFNLYAFSHIAIYGCSYIEAAKLTWEFMMHSIWTAVINDILIDRVFILVMLFEAAGIGAACYFMFNSSWIALAAGVLVTIVVANVVFNTINSGVVTLMVTIAEEPQVFDTKHKDIAPKLYHALNEMRKGCCDGGDS